MKAVFEKISKYADTDLPLPVRATKGAAGYDFVVAEDIVVPSFWGYFADWTDECAVDGAFGLESVAAEMKEMGTKPTLVPTGIKCKLNDGYYLELSVRSSTPLKHWLVLANGVGIIDQDYYGNPDNEGHIYFQMINFSPVDIQLKRGDKIGQGIIKKYELAADDNSTAERQGGFGSTTNAQACLKNENINTFATANSNAAMILDNLNKALEKEYNKIIYGQGGLI